MSDTDELRDRLAVLCGWRPIRWAGGVAWELRHGDSVVPHPFPPGDLTALAAAWPEGWQIRIGRGEYTDLKWLWCASGVKPGRVDAIGNHSDFHAADGYATEYEARIRLTVAVLEAEKGA